MQAEERNAVPHRSPVLVSGHRYRATLVHYRGAESHPRHTHEAAQATLLLAGGFEDDSGRGGEEAFGQRFGFRPPASYHSCRFAKEGALILSINWREAQAPRYFSRGFRPIDNRSFGLCRALAGNCLGDDDAIDDLLAVLLNGERSLDCNSGPTAPSPPFWLLRAAERLREEPLTSVEALAQDAGVHRVVLSRMFQRHLGTSPSLYRLNCKFAQAMRLIIESGETAAAAATAAGFADQPHLTRTARILTGLPPARMAKLFAPSVTSVQDAAHQRP